MDLQTLLIDGIEFLESLPYSAENSERADNWREHLDQVNIAANPPKCPLGYTWDNVLKTCVFDG